MTSNKSYFLCHLLQMSLAPKKCDLFIMMGVEEGIKVPSVDT